MKKTNRGREAVEILAEPGAAALREIVIERMSLEEITPADYNPRKALKAGDEDYDKLRRSLETFGLVEPLVWNRRTGRLVGGHQRLTVLRDLGIQAVDVSVVDVDEEREKVLNVALNKIEGDWDNGRLAALLAELAPDLQELTGFGEADIDALLGSKGLLDGESGGGMTSFDMPPVSGLGDLWLLGQHRVLCGDACKAEDMAGLMDGQKARLVITDPPYNVNYGDKAEMLEEYAGKGHRNTSRILNDHMDDASFRTFLDDALARMYEASMPGAAIYVFHADTEGVNFRSALVCAGFKLSQCLIWVKSSIVLGRNDYHWRHEPILYGWRDDGPHKWYGGRKKQTTIDEGACVNVRKDEDGTVFTFSDGFNHFVLRAQEYEIIDDGHDDTMTVLYHEKPSTNDLHPTMKPVRLLEKLMRNSSRRGDLVLDPFGGSGSTLIAAQRQGRRCSMMELDPRYCDTIAARYAAEFGADTVRLVRGGIEVPRSEYARVLK